MHENVQGSGVGHKLGVIRPTLPNKEYRTNWRPNNSRNVGALRRSSRHFLGEIAQEAQTRSMGDAVYHADELAEAVRNYREQRAADDYAEIEEFMSDKLVDGLYELLVDSREIPHDFFERQRNPRIFFAEFFREDPQETFDEKTGPSSSEIAEIFAEDRKRFDQELLRSRGGVPVEYADQLCHLHDELFIRQVAEDGEVENALQMCELRPLGVSIKGGEVDQYSHSRKGRK
jgi:hypothetical protein